MFDPFRWQTNLLVFLGDLLVIRRAIAKFEEKYFGRHLILFKKSEETLGFQ
jgi:hypothetical protein